MLKIGCCGDDCKICPRYLATQSGDEKRPREAAICEKELSAEDNELFQKAFFSKKERLDKIQKEKNTSNKRNIP